jgi:hypothetical protein
MLTILQASQDEHYTDVHHLFQEYLQWVCPAIHREYSVTFDCPAVNAWENR